MFLGRTSPSAASSGRTEHARAGRLRQCYRDLEAGLHRSIRAHPASWYAAATPQPADRARVPLRLVLPARSTDLRSGNRQRVRVGVGGRACAPKILERK